MNIILNPKYGIRNDTTCSYLCPTGSFADDPLSPQFPPTALPPLFGFILSQFTGNSFDQTISTIAEKIGLKAESISAFASKLINNRRLILKHSNQNIIFPPNVLIEGTSFESKIVTVDDHDPFNLFVPKRPQLPIRVNIMLTTKCLTDCIYCYADRNKKEDFEKEKIISIIHECYEKGVLSVGISGGDIFAYKDWKTVIGKMADCNYLSPFISTKIPLCLEDIILLKKAGVKIIQFSLDSVHSDELKAIVKVQSDYLPKVSQMLSFCMENDMEVEIRTVLTKYNVGTESISALYRFLSDFKIRSWNVIPALFSEYKGEYTEYRATEKELKQAAIFIKEIKSHTHFPIADAILEERTTPVIKYKDTNEFVNKNKGCLITINDLTINVQGKIVLCEMLYNNQHFHIDDIHTKGIEEVWNSKPMNDFHNFQISSLKKNEDSPCYTCNNINSCKIGQTKKVCIVDVIKSYGLKKWDYPDPRCPKAPPCNMDLLL